MSSKFIHKDKLENNKGILMQISLITSLLIVLLLFENKTRSTDLKKDAYIGIDIIVNHDADGEISLPIPNADNSEHYPISNKKIEADFPGGYDKLKTYMKEEMQYSSEAKKKDIQGRVIVRFTVTEKGKIENAKIIRSIHPLIDTEALRLILHMPDWEPEKVNGTNVSSIQTLPVIFINTKNHES